MQHCSTPELLIPKSDSVPLGEPPHITASTLQGHFTLLLQFQWHPILYSTYEWIMWRLSFSTWLISLRTMISCSFHFKQWGFIFSVVVYYVVFHHIVCYGFLFHLWSVFISWLLWTVMQYTTSTGVSSMYFPLDLWPIVKLKNHSVVLLLIFL